ncbi:MULTISPECIES: GNAT family N-acetyltransferase [Burkholderia]|uniref:GNAT family N-acetyltransferase n=1 Tax=Burkholderia TaxID=32008 RepID=UPI00119C8D3F|nr:MULTISPECIES: GNAT family N-acetyltransferase [Burkholderia]TWC75726.1 ribosomal protein S18 acetylase RimI-like enzyme [Burkholderia sp. SJZ089]TWD05239.1 ribosomal protein S18 acetylase RimI-like enzyme [Burkholderia sp. SJZ115]MBU9166601.1 GNAT family N-acetyltransferase [Burkholderia gladioli]MBU9382362.1 GNAT family N-acetyltransferase [Burkholderia gladioli]MDN7738114.1 GNAT family N-acetyltransferase [Burkholderia gladioli]
MALESPHTSTSCTASIHANAELTVQASTAEDQAFLHAVFVTTRREEFMRTGWPSERVEAFLHEQSRMQDRYYRQHYGQGRFDVVRLDGEPIGRLYHAWRPEQLGEEARVIDIALLPAWRGRGIGTRLMQAVVAEADRQGLPVSLQVEVDNPVQALYRRLGFSKIGNSGIYDTMRRECGAGDLPASAAATRPLPLNILSARFSTSGNPEPAVNSESGSNGENAHSV